MVPHPSLPSNDIVVTERKSATRGLPSIEQDYRLEVMRKAIHLCSISIPVVYFNFPRSVTLLILIPLAFVFTSIDIARYYNQTIERWFYHWFGFLLRRHESDPHKKTLNGATYVVIAATICVAIFPKIIAVTSFIILIFSDMTSALVGRRIGRHRFFNKSVEGSLAFFVSALIVIACTPKVAYRPVEYIIGAIAALVGAIVEALPIEIDDNLSIPICVGFTLWGLYLLLAPGLTLDIFG
jgi:dolichol kinase